MQLTEADIAKLGTLGRLALTTDKQHVYAEQLSRIIEYTERIAEAELDTPLESLRSPISPQHLREDISAPSATDLNQQTTAKLEGRFIVSPPIA